MLKKILKKFKKKFVKIFKNSHPDEDFFSRTYFLTSFFILLIMRNCRLRSVKLCSTQIKEIDFYLIIKNIKTTRRMSGYVVYLALL